MILAAYNAPDANLLWLAAAVSVVGAITTIASVVVSRRSAKEANETQHEAVASQKKLDEVDALRGVVDALNTEVDRLRVSLHDANESLDRANGKADRLNEELVRAQKNVRTLRWTLRDNGVPIPTLEPMRDVS